jgi:glycosyltransferase involved in cell wall biosynthesis
VVILSRSCAGSGSSSLRKKSRGFGLHLGSDPRASSLPRPRSVERSSIVRIAIFDYRVVATNAIGGCHRRLLDSLSRKHDFTVFAVEFDNPCPERITWVRVPAPGRPLALLFLSYHLLAPLCYVIHRLRRSFRFDLVQIVESNIWFGDLSYTHFCHRGFLRRGDAGGSPSVLRGLLRWLDHRLHATFEPWVLRRARSIVVPSAGLARELHAEYPETADKLTVIVNPIDLPRMELPAHFDRREQRSLLGLGEGDVVTVFVAAGHFERKGLPILLAALEGFRDTPLRLLVVGGQPDLVRSYARAVRARGLEGTVLFVGMQNDIRPFLWASDLFALPSSYEAWPMVVLEAAAAGLPLLVTRLHGVEDMIEDGHNGFVVERTAADVAAGLHRFSSLSTGERRAMGERARASVQGYGVERFSAAWSEYYARLQTDL